MLTGGSLQVLHSALNPLEPYGEDPLPWWMSGEKPWQLLAACFDVQRAIASGNPETYLSNLPVHQVHINSPQGWGDLQLNGETSHGD